MSVSYNTVLRLGAIAVNAVTGATPALLETSYSTVPLTSANFGSSILPFTNLKDKMLNGISKIVTAAANTGNHPYRAALITQTAALAYGDEVLTDSSSVPVIGNWGAVRDDATGQILTNGNLAQIRARVTNPATMFVVDVFWWARDDVRVYHTVDNVVIDVVAYARPDTVALNLSSNIPLPDDSIPTCVQAMLEECIRDDEFLSQGARFGAQFDRWLAQVKANGSTDSTTVPVEIAA